MTVGKLTILLSAVILTGAAAAAGLLDILYDGPASSEKRHGVHAADPAATAADGVATNAAPAAVPRPVRTGRPAKITSDSVVYDRKEGVAVFDGAVHVDDEQYQIHADKAYVFMAETNDVKRIVAVGNVAMTNDTRRAYGAKVSYYRQSGMVVLYSGDGVAAEVRDEAKAGDQSVKGEKIKFWINSEQVEVLKATISAPRGGMGADDLKKALKR